jgi:hypothetical protein
MRPDPAFTIAYVLMETTVLLVPAATLLDCNVVVPFYGWYFIIGEACAVIGLLVVSWESARCQSREQVPL